MDGLHSPDELARLGNQRRLRVFAIAFLGLLLGGLAITFARQPEYRANARISISSARAVADSPVAGQAESAVAGAPAEADAGALYAEIGVLTSRGLIESSLAALHRKGVDLPEFGPDPVQAVQANLATDVENRGRLVTLSLTGPQPEHLAALLNTLIDVYTGQLRESYAAASTSDSATLQEELQALDSRLTAKRKAVEDFRQANDIVSEEHGENQVLARVKGLAESLNQANDKAAQAEGRLRSLRESQAAGRAVVRAKDNPTLAAMETRASQLRETLREQARTYTPEFMAMDPNAKGMQSRLADLERQINEQRDASARTALAEAEEELATARQARQRLAQQIAEERGGVHAFSRRFNAFKAMQEELAQLEASRRKVSERLLRTETSEKARRPEVKVVESAAVPHEIWRPDYARDAGISLGLAFGAGLMAMGFVELFNRAPRGAGTQVIVPQPWISIDGEPAGRRASTIGSQPPMNTPLPRTHPRSRTLAAPCLPRELSAAETADLLAAAGIQDFPLVALLLAGATLGEIRAGSGADVDRQGECLRLSGRTLPLPGLLLDRLAGQAAGNAPLVAAADGGPLSPEEASRRLMCVAHDADIDEPAEVGPDTLRHTCIAHLVRQGLRFGELEHVVGPLPAETLAAYHPLSPPDIRHGIGDIDPLLPALRALADVSATPQT